MLSECYRYGRDSSSNRLILDFASEAESLSQVSFNVLDLSVVDIYWSVVFPSSPLSSTRSSSDPDFHVLRLIAAAFGVAHVVN